jgi:SAM-dependent methyltransferase
MNVEKTVQGYYTDGGLLERILSYLEQAGHDPQHLKPEDLFPVDQLHARGIDATQEHVERAGITAEMHVLEIGSGLGGASRYMASACGCRVTGIDLTDDYVHVASELTARCGLVDRIGYRQANALDLPFEDSAFDHVYSHYVTMNIEDKTGLAKEITHVLKPGDRYSCSEISLGPAGDLFYPLPWADDPSSSFLTTPDEMCAALEAGGLRVVEQVDLNEPYLAYMREVRARAERGEPPLQATHLIIGKEFLNRVRNAGKCVVEGRTVDQLIIAEKA